MLSRNEAVLLPELVEDSTGQAMNPTPSPMSPCITGPAARKDMTKFDEDRVL